MNESVDKKSTMQVRIDAGLHHLLKQKAAAEKTTIKVLIEGALAELLKVNAEILRGNNEG